MPAPAVSPQPGHAPLRTAPGVREGWLARAARLLAGDDVFVSYSRADASDYALALALADELTKARLSCFLDQWGTEPKRELPADLKRALRRSGALVVVASPAAARSRFAGEEVIEFRRLRRPILPVSIGGAERDAAWHGEIAGLAVSVDTADDLARGRPGDDVVRRIVSALRFRSRRRRLRLGLYATALLLLAAGVAAAVASRSAARATRRSESLALANAASARLGSDPAGALRLGLEASAGSGGLQAQRVLLDALRRYPRLAYVARLHGGGGAASVAFSPDGALLAAGGTDGRVWFWDLRGMRLHAAGRRMHWGLAEVPLAFSPDGRWLVSGGIEGNLVVWSTARLAPAAVREVEVPIRALAFRRDGLLAVNSRAGLVLLWRIGTRGELQPAGSIDLEEEHPVTSLAFSPDGGTLAVASAGLIFLADPNRAVVRDTIIVPADESLDSADPAVSLDAQVTEVAFSPDGRTLMAADGDEQVREWRVDTRKRVRPLLYVPSTQRPAGRTLAFHGRALLTGSASGAIRAWQAAEGEPLELRDTLGVYAGEVRAVATSPGGRLLASANADGTVALWALEGPPRLTRDLPRTVQFGIPMDGAARRFLVGNAHGGLGLWDSATGDTTTLSTRGADHSALDPRGSRAAAAWRDTLAVWELGSPGTAPTTARTGLKDRARVRFSPDGAHVVVWNDDGAVMWDAGTRRVVPVTNAGEVLALSPDGGRLAATDSLGRLYVVATRGNAPPRLLASGGTTSAAKAAAFTGARELLSYHQNGAVVRWRLGGLRSGPTVLDTVASTNPVQAYAAFSADGRRLAVVFAGETPMVWDVEERLVVLPSSGRTHDDTWVALSADGSTLVTWTGDRAHAVDLSPGAWVRAACSILMVAPDSTRRGGDRVARACTRARPR